MKAPAAGAWVALLLLTAALTATLSHVHAPAALVLGPMVSAIAVTLWRPGLRLPRSAGTVAQAVLGCLIASAFSPGLLKPLLSAWPALIGINLLSMLLLMALGAWVARRQWMPGTAAIWGMSPGGASTMVLLSEAYGADPRLVALMQYLRLIAAALSVIAVGTLFGRPAAAPTLALPGAAGVAWLAPLAAGPALATLALAASAIAASQLLRRPTLAILLPVFAGIALQAGGWTHLTVPPPVSALAFAAIGWHVGLGFTRQALVQSARLLPRILLCIVAVLGASAALAWGMSALLRIDFMTAYMALNPGGMDAVVLMAATLQVDLPLILAMQVARLMMVIVVAPMLGRVAARHHLASRPAP
jgi:membrane AbrB-like protein